MNTAVCCMYDDLEALNVDVVDVKLKNNFAIAFFDNFLVIDRSNARPPHRNALCWRMKQGIT